MEQDDILQEEGRDLYPEEADEADEAYDAESAVCSQYYQDKNDCSAMSQMHYDDHGE